MFNPIYPLAPLVNNSPRPLSGPCGALAVQPCLAPVPAIPAVSTPPAVLPPNKRAAAPPAPLPSLRCSVKGCVFPAPIPGYTKCRYHTLLQSEGELFESRQPTLLMSRQMPFGLSDEEPDDSRQQDRKRQAAEREEFLMGDSTDVGG
jgi:hypothetical protein